MSLSNKELIVKFIANIREGRYTAESLDDTDLLVKTISEDIGCEPSKAKSILGYLLDQEFIAIDPSEGIIRKDVQD
jgi:hypothetical protein